MIQYSYRKYLSVLIDGYYELNLRKIGFLLLFVLIVRQTSPICSYALNLGASTAGIGPSKR